MLAGALAGIESLIGSGKELIEAVAQFVLLPSRGEGDGEFLSLPEDFDRAEALEDKLQLLQGAFRKDNKKLVAAQSYGEVRATDNLVEMEGKFVEDMIASGMAVLVVDLLEFVQVESEDGEGMAAAFGTGDFCCQALESEAAIIKTGQGVHHGQITENVGMALFFGQLTAKAFDEDLLIDGVDVENHD